MADQPSDKEIPAQTAPESVPPEKPKSTYQLNPLRMGLKEHLVAEFVVTVEQGIGIDQCLDPAFWAHVASQFTPYTEITARTDDGTWYAKFLVLSCGRGWAKVKPIMATTLTTSDVDMTQADRVETHEINWGGPFHKFRVIRKRDSVVVKSQCQTKSEATAWLADHLRTQ